MKAGKRPDHLPWADLANPDLQMELVFTGARKYRFAVECKWRRECIDAMINWEEVPQIQTVESGRQQFEAFVWESHNPTGFWYIRFNSSR